MIKLEQITELKEQIHSLQQQAAKAQGAIEQILKQLKEEFNVSSIEEAKETLRKLEQEKVELEQKLEDSYKKFIEKWSHLF